MQRLFITVLACLMSVSVYSQYDLTKMKKRGKVKYLAIKIYDVIEKFGEIEKQRCTKDEEWFFDELGHPVKGIQYQSEGVKLETNYQYNITGNLVKENGYANDSLVFEVIYEYDKTGSLVKVTEYDPPGIIEKIKEFKYDQVGNKVSETTYKYEYEIITHKMTYEYDKLGNEIENISYGLDGNVYDRRTYTYNEKGKIKSETKYYEGEKTEFHYKYDNKGNKVEKIIIPEHKPQITTFYFYRQDGSLEKIKGGRHNDITIFDFRGNVIQHERHLKNGKTVMSYFEYIYDHMGNYTTATFYKDGSYDKRNAYELQEFKLEYYD